MLRWIHEQLALHGLDEVNARKVELASEEALVNIIQHAYKNTEGEVDIEIKEGEGNRIEIEIRDSGPPFNPLKQKTTFDPLASLEEREIGGLGILFIRQYMDDVRYRRDGSANVLTLVKKVA
ncbi:MAG: ATP-binding protein [Verrucomicrobiota bacterium]|nr:ATP-binding protein [Verrucomicrobiota bacterium]